MFAQLMIQSDESIWLVYNVFWKQAGVYSCKEMHATPIIASYGSSLFRAILFIPLQTARVATDDVIQHSTLSAHVFCEGQTSTIWEGLWI